jgi:excisionase family DNA binding protein
MSVRQVAEYLQLNEKKIYALVHDGAIPATKVTGKWMFPRELVDRWMLNSAHGGLLSDRLLIAGSDDPLLYRLVLAFAQESGARALISYTPTGTRLGLELLQSGRVDLCGLHWGPHEESRTRHPAMLRQYSSHRQWILIRAFRREQGILLRQGALAKAGDLASLFHSGIRWALRQNGSGAQRYFLEVLSHHGLNADDLACSVTALSERDAATAVAMGQADAAPGARAAARECGLEFLPLGWESFDLAMPRDIWFRRLLQNLLQRLRSGNILAMAKQLGGYDLEASGKLVWGEE